MIGLLNITGSYAPGLYGMSDSGHPRTASYGDSYGVSQVDVRYNFPFSSWDYDIFNFLLIRFHTSHI